MDLVVEDDELFGWREETWTKEVLFPKASRVDDLVEAVLGRPQVSYYLLDFYNLY